VTLSGKTSDAAAVQALEPDLFACLGTELPPDSVTSSARLGTVAFEWADVARRKDLPIGLWEVFGREDTTGFAILRIEARSASHSILLRGRVPTRHYYVLNQAALYEKAHFHLRRLLGGLALSGTLPAPGPSTPTAR
jgi:hypothetical protein